MIEISIHALLAESDCCARCHCWGLNEFLSTLSLRRATLSISKTVRRIWHFYPRSPCGERHVRCQGCPIGVEFLSTLSLRRATTPSVFLHCTTYLFLSTLSLRRATLAGPSGPAFLYNFYPRSPCGERLNDAINGRNPDFISIHALLAESDIDKIPNQCKIDQFLSTLSLRRATSMLTSLCCGCFDFYPRSPCGERRLTIMLYDTSSLLFLSTLSLRRATV